MKYKAIAEQIITDIHSEKLVHGQRLPSLRQLTKQWGISMTTALNSYRRLEQMGWIVTHPRSGFFVSVPFNMGDVPNQPQFQSSLKSVSTNEISSDFQYGSAMTTPFGISQLSSSELPLLALKRSIKRTVQRGDEFLHSYPDPKGVFELRRALSDHFSDTGFALNADELCISNGCMDAIRLALLASTKPGDAVGISSPCFNGLLKLLASMSRRVIEIPCTENGLDLQQLENKLDSREIQACLLSSSFMNPHGISLSTLQKQTLAQLANKYSVPMIEDDVYGELGYENTFPLPIKYWDTQGYVIWCSSISKTLSNGLRIGWCAPGRYLSACVDLCASERLGQNGLMQASLADFVNSGQYRNHLQRIRKTVLGNAHDYRRLLMNNLPKGSAISAPQGGLVLWIQVPGLDPVNFKALLDKDGIDLRFGAQFTTRNLYRDCFRINLGWGLTEMFDSKRTVKQALLQLTLAVGKSTLKLASKERKK